METTSRNVDNKSIHHGHMPDTDILSEMTARGHWMLFNTYLSPAGRNDQWGFYEDDYVKVRRE